ncbi:hypothetical protein ABTF50_20805, partial [Acinetobacter baumannii]
GASFNDITTGSTPNGDGVSPGFAYNSVPGYDLTTGLGTPKCTLAKALATNRRTSDIVWRQARSGNVSVWRMRDNRVTNFGAPYS